MLPMEVIILVDSSALSGLIRLLDGMYQKLIPQCLASVPGGQGIIHT